MGDSSPKVKDTTTHYDLNDKQTEADILYILGLIPKDKLLQLANNVAQIRKTVNFGKVFLRVSKGNVVRTGIYYEE